LAVSVEEEEEEGAVEIFILVFVMYYTDLKFNFIINSKGNLQQMNTQLNGIFEKWIDLSLAARLRGVKGITAMTNVPTYDRNLQTSTAFLI